MFRSQLLRGMDSDMTARLAAAMSAEGTTFAPAGVLPTGVEKAADGSLRVHASDGSCRQVDTVLLATGRSPATQTLGLAAAGVDTDARGAIVCDDSLRTTLPSVWAAGDAVAGQPQLTPTAIHAGRHLARTWFAAERRPLEWRIVPTTVFTPVEYAFAGVSEEEAALLPMETAVFHSAYQPLEMAACRGGSDERLLCYAKLICEAAQPQRLLGLHVLGPSAGEVVQGFALALQAGVSRADLQDAIGIHPTHAEEVLAVTVDKASGLPYKRTSC